jgi:hypothetical protein
LITQIKAESHKNSSSTFQARKKVNIVSMHKIKL